MYDNQQGGTPDQHAFFSDTTADYVTPVQPDLFEMITIRLRVGRGQVRSCFLVTEDTRQDRGGGHRDQSGLLMRPVRNDACFDYYEVRFELTRSPLRYYFVIYAGGRRYRYTRRGVRNTIRPADYWHIVPGFHTPAWAEGAVMYQIFVDRFCNGDPSNDVQTGEYSYLGQPSLRVADWDRPPSFAGYREFYGGDLQGVINRLDYLQRLGVEAIYLNPVFLSPSSHKYDTQDYDHIDPHFGRIVHDRGSLLFPQERDRTRPGRTQAGRTRYANLRATRYLDRVTDPSNLAAGDRLFARLVREAHARGIRVILDGVFNHCGSFHRWLDRERIYEQLPGGSKGAMASRRSPYVDYFRFEREQWPSNNSYDAWWNFETLPKLNYENSEALCQYILKIGRKWVSPPYHADGWRLDVAADLGYSREFNHAFWQRFRAAVKEANPDAIILAENYTDSQEWLQGNEWDTIMNYEFFMEPVTFFLTGMEKHSDARSEERYGDPDAFWRAVSCHYQDAMPDAALRISMNELSNHDHSRFLTRTNRLVGRADSLGTDAATQGIHMEVMRQAVLLQMTWTGAPTIYYGDEAGLGGFTDPDSRRTYPWGHEDISLLDYHRILANLRRRSPALRRGSLLRLPDGDGLLAYARFIRGEDGADAGAADGGQCPLPEEAVPESRACPARKSGTAESYIILININHIPIEYEARVIYAGIPEEAALSPLLLTGRDGYAAGSSGESVPVKVEGGRMRLTLPPQSGLLLRWSPRDLPEL